MLAVLVALVGPVSSSARTGSAVAAARGTGRWVLERTDVDVVASPDNVTSVSHSPGRIVRLFGDGWPGANVAAGWPIAEFTGSYTPPPPELTPGAPVSITVTVSGSIRSSDRVGAVGMTVIQYVGDRWNRAAVGTAGDCAMPIMGGPITCRQAAEASGTFVWTPPAAGTTFSMGIGVLNERAGITWRYRFETGARPADTTVVTDTRAPSMRSGTTLRGIAKLVARYGDPALPAELTTPALVTPPQGFRVQLAVRRGDRVDCAPSDRFSFGVGGKVLGASRIDPQAGACQFEVRLPEGVHQVTMTMTAQDGTTGTGVITITVQDWLVFGLGDSNGAGEGAPKEDIATVNGVPDPLELWTNERCHRSTNSYQAMTARTVENQDDLTSVTFVHLACSGASIQNGMLGGYEGIEPPSGSALLPGQVREMQRLAAGREIDAVIVSIGINDIGFGPLVLFCIERNNCPAELGFVRSKNTTLDAFVLRFLNRDPKAKDDTLWKRYQRLAEALRRAGVNADRVFITQYFDPTKYLDPTQNALATCNPLISLPGGYEFTQLEAQWAAARVLTPLNLTVRDAAARYGWRVVTGVAEGFAAHGYCDGDQSWIRSLTSAVGGQGDASGTLHATPVGNAFTSSLVTPVIAKSLYPSGAARQPRR
jgi:lysophospholipase L1-like esterase